MTGKKIRKWALIVFISALMVFILWNMHRAGIINREVEDVIARADYLIEKSERSMERWRNAKWR